MCPALFHLILETHSEVDPTLPFYRWESWSESRAVHPNSNTVFVLFENMQFGDENLPQKVAQPLSAEPTHQASLLSHKNIPRWNRLQQDV